MKKLNLILSLTMLACLIIFGMAQAAVPVAYDQNVTVDEDKTVNITLSATDADSDALTFYIVSHPAKGALNNIEVVTNKVLSFPIIYNANSNNSGNFNGMTSFSFRVSDGTDYSNTATVNITVNPVNDTPDLIVLNKIAFVTPQQQVVKSYQIQAVDVEGDKLTFSASNLPAGADLNSDTGELRWTIPAGAVNIYTNIIVRVSDGQATRSKTVSLIVKQPQTYYVDAVNGDNAYAGTENSPFKTIQKAVDTAVAGDTVLVNPGVYKEAVTLNNGGTTAEDIIVIKAASAEKPVLYGGEAVIGWTRCQADDGFLTVQGTINQNFEKIWKTKIHKSKLPQDLNKFMIFEDGVHSRIARSPDQQFGYGIDMKLFNPVAPEAYGQTDYLLDTARLTQEDNYWAGAWVDVFSHAANAWILRRTIKNNSNHKLYFDIPLSQPISYGSAPDSYCIVNHPHVLDSAGEFAHTMNPDADGYYTFYLWPKSLDNIGSDISIPIKSVGFYSYAKSYVTIEDFKIFGYVNQGIYFDSVQGTNINSVKVKGCIVEDVGRTAIFFVYADDSIIENCQISRAGDRGAFISTGNRCIIRGCNIRDAASTSASFYGMQYGQIIGNTLYGCIGAHGNGSSCYINCDKILIAYNYYPRSNLALQDIKNVVVYANVLDSEELATAFVSTWADAHGQSAEYQVYLHNTILGSSNNSSFSVPVVYNWIATTSTTTPPSIKYYRIGDLRRRRTTQPFGRTIYRCVKDHYADSAVNEIEVGSDWTSYWEEHADGEMAKNYVINNIVDGFGGWYGTQELRNNFYTGFSAFQESRYGWSLGMGEIDGRSYSLSQLFNAPGESNGANYFLKEDSPVIGKGQDISDLLEQIGVTAWFPDFDFTKDKAGNTWANPPSMGAYEYAVNNVFYGALAARIAVGLDPVGDKLTVADVSGDKQVTAYDAALIAQKAVGLISKFPVE